MAAFSGGDRLEATLKEIARKLNKKATLKVGFLAGATYPDGTSVAMVAAINEFGAPSRGQPPRPYFRRMIAAKSPAWGKALGANLAETDYDVDTTLQRMGEGIKGQLVESIMELTDPPLAPSTIKRKGFAKPLIDTSHMVNSADYEVTGDG